ncbi:MAG TPA: MTAP family purine nucleoside phosphorylase [Tepidisphaeraceae bacterium]|jgi:5'-methylthioadenosine phosphorylase
MSQLTVGLIGGTGLGEALGAGADGGGARHVPPEIDTPFGRPSDAIIETEWAGVRVLILSRHGPGHLLNPAQVPYRANIFALKQMGCTHILASGAVGSLREEYRPRDLVIPDQIIDKTHRRPGTFYEKAAVHVEFAEPFCPVLRKILVETAAAMPPAEAQGVQPNARGGKPHQVHDGGCYVCMEGPAFSTRAESLMHRLWGGDLVGMTAMPEAKLAREAEISYALVALVTDYDSWRVAPAATQGGQGKLQTDSQVLLEEIIGNVQAATANTVSLMRAAVERIAARREELLSAPAQRALRLAIWSNKSAIDPAEVQRLSPLWMKYFEAGDSAGG